MQRGGSLLMQGTMQAFVKGGIKPITVVRVAGASAESRTRHFPNTS